MKNLNLKQFFLYLLIASVLISALLAIGVILLGNWGELETKIILTTLTITVTSILGLACGAYLETKRGKILPVSGIIFASLSAILWINLIWNGMSHQDWLEKTLMSSTLLAASCAHLSLLSIAKLKESFLWAFYAAQFSVWTLAIIILFIIWIENNPNETLTRFLGVLAIVIASLTIIIPIFHWLSRAEFTEKETTVEAIEAKITKLKEELSRLEQQREELLKQEN